MANEWLTAIETLEYLRISRATLHRLVKRGALQAFVVAGTNRRQFRRADVEALRQPQDK